MKTLCTMILISGFLLLLIPLTASAEVDLGVTIDESGISAFHLAITKQYNVDEKDIVRIEKKHIPDDELPVVFFLAHHLGVDNSVIIKLRLGGKSWYDICQYYSLSPEIFYVELHKNPGPPYGKAYGHYKNKPKKNWREIYLSDDDIINLVNLKFVSDYYHCDPDLVVEMRGSGRGFDEIHQTIKQNKNNAKKEQANTENKGKKDKAKGKPKKK